MSRRARNYESKKITEEVYKVVRETKSRKNDSLSQVSGRRNQNQYESSYSNARGGNRYNEDIRGRNEGKICICGLDHLEEEERKSIEAERRKNENDRRRKEEGRNESSRRTYESNIVRNEYNRRRIISEPKETIPDKIRTREEEYKEVREIEKKNNIKEENRRKLEEDRIKKLDDYMKFIPHLKIHSIA